MTEIILNEKQWIEHVLATSSMGSRPLDTLNRLACYYHEAGYKKVDVEKMLIEFIIRCDPSANIYKWTDVVEYSVKYAWKNKLVKIESIGITKHEMDLISDLDGVMRQKLMFTLLCIAKYGNAVNKKNSSWVNIDTRSIMNMANISLSLKRQSLLINDLKEAMYIGFSHIVDNVNVNVKIVDDDDTDFVINVDDFRNLGNQYMMYTGKKYIKCKSCGLTIKRVTNNQMYCKECSVVANIRKTSENRLMTSA